MTGAELMRDRLLTAHKESERRKSDLAEALGVTRQAVNGWFKTGRVDKARLPGIAMFYRVPVDYFVDANTEILHFAAHGTLFEPDDSRLRYAIFAAFPSLNSSDVDAIVAYARGRAEKAREAKVDSPPPKSEDRHSPR